MRELTALGHIAGKNVLVRIDTDIELSHGHVTDDYRLKAALPTIRWLIGKEANITLIGHLGRPAGQVVAELSLKSVAAQLSQLLVPHTYPTITHQPADSPVFATVYRLAKGIRLLENLRFDPGEEANEPEFVRLLAAEQDYYVNESFAAVHRKAASTVGVAKALPSYAGLRVSDELTHLDLISKEPERPFTLIVGGAKVEEKLGLLDHFLPHVDHVLTGGLVANMLLRARGVPIKDSKIEPKLMPLAEMLVEKKAAGKMVLPIDYVWHQDRIVDLGSATVAAYNQLIQESETIFWAGSLGVAEDERFAVATLKVAQQLARHRGVRIVGGGDTVAALQRFHLLDRMSFVSTGGGAALEYLAGKKLPGLSVLE